MNNIEKYDLLNNIIAYINTYDYDATITNLAKDCNTPIPYMRKLLLSLLDNQVIHTILRFDEDDELLDHFIDEPEEFAKELLAGEYDNLYWFINFNILDYDENALLPLSHIEYGTLKSFGEDILSIKRGSLFEKKVSVSPVPEKVQNYQTTLINAANNKQAVTFDYIDSKGKSITEICHPIRLRTNLIDNWIYMETAEGKTYRLDRIRHRCEIAKNAPEFPSYMENSKKKYAWGSYFNDELEPEHVKLKIYYKDTPNLLSKIENDIRYREATCSFTKYDGYYIYEDDIIGMGEFLRWTRGYGSSIKVLEPKATAETIVENAHKTLDLYEMSKTWGDL